MRKRGRWRASGEVLPIKRLGGPERRLVPAGASVSTARLVDDLRHYQSELEIQNRALRFSQSAAEDAYERFVSLFSNVPLALMVVDDSGQILENNARALALLRPVESDPPLTYFQPLVSANDLDLMQKGFATARIDGACELNELMFAGGSTAPSPVICTSRALTPTRTSARFYLRHH